MLFNIGRSHQWSSTNNTSSIHLQEQNGISSTWIVQADYNQDIYVEVHQEIRWSKSDNRYIYTAQQMGDDDKQKIYSQVWT